MYCDLDIIYNPENPNSKINLYELIISAIIDGYNIISVSIIRKGIIKNEEIPNFDFLKIEEIQKIYPQYSIKFLNSENTKLINWTKIKILKRLTIELNEQKDIFQFTNPNNFIKFFDLIAIKPSNDKIFEGILSAESNCDIIVLDLNEKFSFISKKKLLLSSIEKNSFFFEINYGKFVIDNESRGGFISNFILFNEIIKGKNLILSSGAENYFMHRSAFDVITIFETIFDIKHNIVKPMISDNCLKVILKSHQRKFFKTTVDVNIKDKGNK